MENRPTLDEIILGSKTQPQGGVEYTQATQQTTQRPSLDDIISGNTSSSTPTTGAKKNNKKTLFRSETGNYLDALVPDGGAQTAVNFVGDIVGSTLSGAQSLGNTMLGAVNKGVEYATGRQVPENMRVTPENERMTNPITGEYEAPTYVDPKTGQTLGIGGTLARTAGTVGRTALDASQFTPVGALGQATKLSKGVFQRVIKPTLATAGYGAGYGATEGLQEMTDPTKGAQWGNLALQTGLGTGGGLLLGGGLAGVGAVLNRPVLKAMKEAETKLGKAKATAGTTVDDLAVAQEEYFNNPAVQRYLKSIGINSADDIQKAREKGIDEVLEMMDDSSRVTMTSVLKEGEKDPQNQREVIGVILDNFALPKKLGQNKVNWAPTLQSMENKKISYGEMLEEISNFSKKGVGLDTGITTNALQSRALGALGSVEKNVLALDTATKNIVENILARSKEGKIGLAQLNELRKLANDNYTEPWAKALGNAIRGMSTDIVQNPQQYGLDDLSIRAMNLNEGIWRQLSLLNQAMTVAKKLSPEILIKNTGILRQLTGALGYMASGGNFLGYVAGNKATDILLDNASKDILNKVFGNVFISAGDNSSKVAKKAVMEVLEQAEKDRNLKILRNKARLIAQAKERAITEARYTPPNHELYEPYIPDDQLPSFDVGKVPKKKPSTEPYIDYTTREIVDPKNKEQMKALKKVLAGIAGAGATGSASAGSWKTNTNEKEIEDIKSNLEKVEREAVSIAPNIDPKYIRLLVEKESSLGKNDAHRTANAGKYGWLVGFTKDNPLGKGSWDDLLRKAKTDKRYARLLKDMGGENALDTPYGAIRAGLLYSRFKMRDFTAEQKQPADKNDIIYKKGLDASDVYAIYNGGGNPNAKEEFDALWKKTYGE